MQQTFSATAEPKVIIAQVNGDLNVRGWDQQTIGVETDGHGGQLYQEGDALMIADCESDIDLRVPFNTDIKVSSLSGDVAVGHVRRVELRDSGGDVERDDSGSKVELGEIGGMVERSEQAAE